MHVLGYLPVRDHRGTGLSDVSGSSIGHPPVHSSVRHAGGPWRASATRGEGGGGLGERLPPGARRAGSTCQVPTHSGIEAGVGAGRAIS
jgi:hypothetical protein